MLKLETRPVLTMLSAALQFNHLDLARTVSLLPGRFLVVNLQEAPSFQDAIESPESSFLWSAAIKGGKRSGLDFLRSINLPYPPKERIKRALFRLPSKLSPVARAVSECSLNMVQWFAETGYPRREEDLMGALTPRSLHVVRWMLDHSSQETGHVISNHVGHPAVLSTWTLSPRLVLHMLRFSPELLFLLLQTHPLPLPVAQLPWPQMAISDEWKSGRLRLEQLAS